MLYFHLNHDALRCLISFFLLACFQLQCALSIWLFRKTLCTIMWRNIYFTNDYIGNLILLCILDRFTHRKYSNSVIPVLREKFPASVKCRWENPVSIIWSMNFRRYHSTRCEDLKVSKNQFFLEVRKKGMRDKHKPHNNNFSTFTLHFFNSFLSHFR